MTPTEYIDAGLALVPIPKGGKRPTAPGWNTRERVITTHDQAHRINGCGIGLAHLYSRTCAIDVDAFHEAEAWLAEHGIDLTALLCAEDAVQIKSGRPNRAKLLYRLPESMEWLPTYKAAPYKTDNGETAQALELRCAKADGSATVQDVLPPSIHPDTGKPYEWHGDWRNLPELPESLLSLWLTIAGEHAGTATIPQSSQSGIIGQFNAAHDPGEILEQHGYRPAGNRWLSPESTTHTPGVVRLPDSDPPRVYSHHGDALATGHSHDAFSVYTVLEHDGDASAAVKAASRVSCDGPASASNLAERLAKRIQHRLCAELNIDPEESPETADSLQVDAVAIERMLNRSFWSGSKSKLFILNAANSVNQYTEKDAWSFLSRACGAVANREAIVSRALAIQPPGKAEDKAQKEAARLAAIPRSIIMDELKWRNQRDHIQWRVDMFAQAPCLALREDAARITLPHVAFPDHGAPDPNIVADYKAHFPELDDVLHMIVAARFAGDRKRAYLWLLASSDWGKGFFTACLAELGLVVEMSVREIERVFEGSPAGKRPEEFKRAWVLAVNEFKSVKSEIKQLESHMQIAPKNQLTSEVELFAKLFMSAENVASLITDHGVEDQFAQRFSLLSKSGAIDDRPLFRQDSGAYRRAVVAYMARELNRLVREYRQLGREESDRQGSAVLRDFHERHGLANFAARFSESMADVADEFAAWLRHESAVSPNRCVCPNTKRTYLRNATKELEDFLHARKPSDQVATIKRRKDDIFRFVSVDGKGYDSHRISGKTCKAVLLEEV